MIFDGIEHQVISPDHFYMRLHKLSIITVDDHELKIVDKMLKLTSLNKNWYFINNMSAILGNLGIVEHRPKDTKFLKYSTLSGKDIRIMNRLVYFADRNKLKDIKRLFNSLIFTQKVISTNKDQKEKVIELMHSDGFFDLLKKYNISKGIELEENLLFLL